MEKRASKPRRANEAGPVGRRAARNLEELRRGRRLSQKELSEAVERLGRPMTMQIVGKAEAGDRRIDVDDLVAFAVALDTTPNRLLLPGTADEGEPVELAPEVTVSALTAWKWALGEEPLYEVPAPDEPLLLRGDRERQFVRENQPHKRPEPYFRNVGHDLEEHPDVARMAAHLLIEAVAEHGMTTGGLVRLIERMDVYRRFGQLDQVIASLSGRNGSKPAEPGD
jgi:transcriptional regulator with XRE-family HTH domain